MCTACQVSVAMENGEDAAAERFADRLLGTINEAGLGLMLSVGHRVGLFEAMRGDRWVTSAELAGLAGLEERYVREWLGAMATGGVVEVESVEEGAIGGPTSDRYRLPSAHRGVLSREGEGMAALFQWIATLAEVETEVVEAFRHGGGVGYERFSRFHAVMAEESAGTVVAGLEEHIVPMVPGLADRLGEGITVLDIGCGSGRAVCELAARFRSSRFVGYDLSEEAIAAARAEAARLGLDNALFEVRDVSAVEDEGVFDLVTGFDVIHDQRDPAGVLGVVRRVLKPGGVFLMQDLRADSRVGGNLDHPLCPFLYTISAMHCMTVSLSQGGAGLGAVWGEQLAVRMLEDAGFEDLRIETLPHDIQNNWYVMRAPL
ncbi:MAG: class I SAM-dependent methyltransferase [Planctomycetota bacterium]